MKSLFKHAHRAFAAACALALVSAQCAPALAQIDPVARGLAANAQALGPKSVNIDSFASADVGSAYNHRRFQAAVAAAGIGGTIYFTPSKTYTLCGVTVPLNYQKIIADGAHIKRCSTSTAPSTTTTAAITAGGSQTIPVASTTGFEVGMEVVVYNSLSPGSYDTQTHTITAIGSGTISVSTPFAVSLTSGATFSAGHFHEIYTNAYGVTVQGGEWDGQAPSPTTSNPYHAKWYWDGVVWNGGGHAIARDMYIHDELSEGILLTGQYALADNNTIINTGGNGIHIFGTAAVLGSPPLSAGQGGGAKATHNWIYNTNQTGTASTSTEHANGAIIFSNQTTDSIITDNYMDTGLVGVGSIDSDDNSSVTIGHNVIKNMTEYAIDGNLPNGQTSGRVVITGNLIYSSQYVDIRATRGSWSGSCGTTGCSQLDGPYRWTFADNYLENTSLSFNGGMDASITGNTFLATGTTSNPGGISGVITLTDCRRCLVGHNKTVNGQNGIYISGTNTYAVSIDGNQIVNAYQAGINFQGIANVVTATIDNGSGSAGNTLTVSANNTGAIGPYQYVQCAGCAGGVYITANGTGTGGNGTYTLSGSTQLLSSATMDVFPVGIRVSNNQIIVEPGFTVNSTWYGIVSRIGVFIGGNQIVANLASANSGHGILMACGSTTGSPSDIVVGNVIRSQNLVASIKDYGGTYNCIAQTNFATQAASNGSGGTNSPNFASPISIY